MPRIYVISPNCYYTFELPTAQGAEVYVGTAPYCQLSLAGVEGLADRHACITCHGAEYMISDLSGLPMGITANGTPVRSVYLMPGVEYRLGTLSISMAVEGQPPPPPSPAYMGRSVQQQPVYAQAVQPSYTGGPVTLLQPVIMPAPPAPEETRTTSPRLRGRRLSPEALEALKSRSRLKHSSGFPFGKVFFILLVLLIIAFFADLLPIQHEEGLKMLSKMFKN